MVIRATPISLVLLLLLGACDPGASSSTPPEPEPEPEPDPVLESTHRSMINLRSEDSDPALMENAIYTPNVDVKALQNTVVARFNKNDGSAVIGYCIDIHGETTDLEVVQPYPGDAGFDELLIDTIAKWRFKPIIVDGEPKKTCTQRTVSLRFVRVEE